MHELLNCTTDLSQELDEAGEILQRIGSLKLLNEWHSIIEKPCDPEAEENLARKDRTWCANNRERKVANHVAALPQKLKKMSNTQEKFDGQHELPFGDCKFIGGIGNTWISGHNFFQVLIGEKGMLRCAELINR